ncbi:hypothetical protein [Xanthobacter sediminis]
MSVIDTTVPYEILIRYSDEGDLQGAHFQRRRIVDVDGERVMDQLQPAQPLAVAAGGSGETLAVVLGDTLTVALARIDTLAVALAAAEARADAAEAEVVRLTATA